MSRRAPLPSAPSSDPAPQAVPPPVARIPPGAALYVPDQHLHHPLYIPPLHPYHLQHPHQHQHQHQHQHLHQHQHPHEHPHQHPHHAHHVHRPRHAHPAFYMPGPPWASPPGVGALDTAQREAAATLASVRMEPRCSDKPRTAAGKVADSADDIGSGPGADEDGGDGGRDLCENRSAGSVGNSERRKQRKPYTITRMRESWSAVEHQRFLVALRLYDRDWKKIESHVGTKTVLQIRSHAQKYFGKVAKFKTGEYIPPARGKRRSNGASAATPAGAAPASSSGGGRVANVPSGAVNAGCENAMADSGRPPRPPRRKDDPEIPGRREAQGEDGSSNEDTPSTIPGESGSGDGSGDGSGSGSGSGSGNGSGSGSGSGSGADGEAHVACNRTAAPGVARLDDMAKAVTASKIGAGDNVSGIGSANVTGSADVVVRDDPSIAAGHDESVRHCATVPNDATVVPGAEKTIPSLGQQQHQQEQDMGKSTEHDLQRRKGDSIPAHPSSSSPYGATHAVPIQAQRQPSHPSYPLTPFGYAHPHASYYGAPPSAMYAPATSHPHTSSQGGQHLLPPATLHMSMMAMAAMSYYNPVPPLAEQPLNVFPTTIPPSSEAMHHIQSPYQLHQQPPFLQHPGLVYGLPHAAVPPQGPTVPASQLMTPVPIEPGAAADFKTAEHQNGDDKNNRKERPSAGRGRIFDNAKLTSCAHPHEVGGSNRLEYCKEKSTRSIGASAPCNEKPSASNAPSPVMARGDSVLSTPQPSPSCNRRHVLSNGMSALQKPAVGWAAAAASRRAHRARGGRNRRALSEASDENGGCCLDGSSVGEKGRESILASGNNGVCTIADLCRHGCPAGSDSGRKNRSPASNMNSGSDASDADIDGDDQAVAGSSSSDRLADDPPADGHANKKISPLTAPGNSSREGSSDYINTGTCNGLKWAKSSPSPDGDSPNGGSPNGTPIVIGSSLKGGAYLRNAPDTNSGGEDGRGLVNLVGDSKRHRSPSASSDSSDGGGDSILVKSSSQPPRQRQRHIIR